MDFRKRNALTQSIFLVRLETDATKLTFHILGTSKRVYKVVFEKDREPKCGCPDQCVRKVMCKHIHFVCEKILKIKPEFWHTIEDIASVVAAVNSRLPHLGHSHVIADEADQEKYNQKLEESRQKYKRDMKDKKAEEFVSKFLQVPEEKFYVRNEECCICLCNIEPESTSKDVMVCKMCLNGVHQQCWSRWGTVNGSSKCVYCRTLIIEKTNIGRTKEKTESTSSWGISLDD